MLRTVKEGVVICHLKRIRIKIGYNQVALAHRMKLSRQAIYSIENEKKLPSIKIALQLADLLEVKVEEIFQIVTDDD